MALGQQLPVCRRNQGFYGSKLNLGRVFLCLPAGQTRYTLEHREGEVAGRQRGSGPERCHPGAAPQSTGEQQQQQRGSPG